MAIATLAQELAAYENTHTVCSADSIAALLNASQDPRCTIRVARRAAQIIAFAIYYPGYDLSSDTYGFHVADICVAAAHRRQGTGKRLMRAIAQEALNQNRQWISLTVLQENQAGLAFYQSLGLSNVPVYFMAAGRTTLSSMR